MELVLVNGEIPLALPEPFELYLLVLHGPLPRSLYFLLDFIQE